MSTILCNDKEYGLAIELAEASLAEGKEKNETPLEKDAAEAKAKRDAEESAAREAKLAREKEEAEARAAHAERARIAAEAKAQEDARKNNQ